MRRLVARGACEDGHVLDHAEDLSYGLVEKLMWRTGLYEGGQLLVR